jgi:hypothetical protein
MKFSSSDRKSPLIVTKVLVALLLMPVTALGDQWVPPLPEQKPVPPPSKVIEPVPVRKPRRPGVQPPAPIQGDCLPTPQKINELASSLVVESFQARDPLPDLVTLRNAASGVYRNGQFQLSYLYEAIIRPSQTTFWPVPGFPVMQIELDRDSDAIYVCARPDRNNPGRGELVIYSLSGYGLEGPGRVWDLFNPPSLSVRPLRVVVVGVGQLPGLIGDTIGRVPVIGWIIDVPITVIEGAFGGFTQALAAFGGGRVERITIRNNEVELASGINLNDPTKATTVRKVPLNP